MSDLRQFGLHPDADQLNAFAEHILPPHEQEQVLTHLAICPECRSIVSLVATMIDAPFRPQIEPARKPWFSGWNLVWPVAVAFAALVPLVLHVRNTESTQGNDKMQTEVAAAHPPETLPPLTAQQPVAEKTLPATPGHISPPTHTADKRAIADQQIPSAAVETNGRAKDRDAFSGPSNLPAGNLRTTTTNFVAGGILGGAQGGPAPAKSSITTGMAVRPSSAPSPPGVPPQMASDMATASAASQTTNLSDTSLPLIETESSLAQGTLKVTGVSPLPSGLPTLSTTTKGMVTLALDTRNTLFYTSDNGKQWKTIPAQWKGRAVKVNLANTPAPGVLHGTARGGISGFAASTPAVLEAKSAAAPKSSSVTGTITDTTGASIPNATVAVSNAAKQTVQTANADASGHFRITGLSAGTYEIEAAAPGFQKLESPVILAASQDNVSNLRLQVGSESESVTVASQSQPLVTSKSLAKKATAPPAPAQPAPLFEITTDTGDHWISFDGESWAHK